MSNFRQQKHGDCSLTLSPTSRQWNIVDSTWPKSNSVYSGPNVLIDASPMQRHTVWRPLHRERTRNDDEYPVGWQFTIDNACIESRQLYPTNHDWNCSRRDCRVLWNRRGAMGENICSNSEHFWNSHHNLCLIITKCLRSVTIGDMQPSPIDYPKRLLFTVYLFIIICEYS